MTRLLATRRRRVFTGVIGGVLVVLAAWAVLDLIRIQSDLRAGERVLRSVRASDLARPQGLARPVQASRRYLDRAHDRARSSLPFVLARPIPLVGQQVAALRSMTRAATQIGEIGADAAKSVQAKLDSATDGANGRVGLLNTAVTEVAVAQTRLAHVDAGNDRWVLPPLRGLRSDFGASLGRARTRLVELQRMVNALRRMFVGPSYYVILAGNNAEMRAGGMPLSAGLAELRDGTITMKSFVPSGDLFLTRGPVPVPEELKDLYGYLSIGAEWRGTTGSPNFPAVAPLYKQMWDALSNLPADGVIYVDVLALRAIVAATGPVELEGVTYTKDNIAQQMMNENYIAFGDPDKQSPRYDLQSKIGVAVFQALNTRPLKLGALVAGLSKAGKGRNLRAWSTDSNLRLVWQQAGVDGALYPNGLQVNLQNISANKLDWYIKPRVSLRTLSVRRGVRRVEMSVTFANDKRTRTSDVVEGLKYTRKNGMADGEHRVLLTAYLPSTAIDVASADPPFTTAGTDGGLKVVGFRYGVLLGERRTVTITFSVPKDQVFHVIPSGRAHPVPYATPKVTVTDAEATVFRL